MGHRRVIFRASQAEDLGLVSVFATAELWQPRHMPCHACLLMCHTGLALSLGTSQGTLLLLDVPRQALPSSCYFVTWNATSQRAYLPLPPFKALLPSHTSWRTAAFTILLQITASLSDAVPTSCSVFLVYLCTCWLPSSVLPVYSISSTDAWTGVQELVVGWMVNGGHSQNCWEAELVLCAYRRTEWWWAWRSPRFQAHFRNLVSPRRRWHGDTLVLHGAPASLTSDSSEVWIFIRMLSISRSLCPIRGLLGPETWPMWSSPR